VRHDRDRDPTNSTLDNLLWLALLLSGLMLGAAAVLTS
jgi:hypothetical protein